MRMFSRLLGRRLIGFVEGRGISTRSRIGRMIGRGGGICRRVDDGLDLGWLAGLGAVMGRV